MSSESDYTKCISHDVTNSRIQEAETLQEKSESLSYIAGHGKLSKKIRAELKFLNQLKNNENFRPEHLHSSNLSNLSAIVQVAQNYPGTIDAFYYPVKGEIDNNNYRQDIDIIADDGKTWIKVIARNPYALERICAGDTEFGARTVIDQAQDLLSFSKQNPHVFVPPSIVMHFVNGITDILFEKLSKIGIDVRGNILESRIDSIDDSDIDEEVESVPDEDENDENKNSLNLDVSTMIAYCSSLTNGGSHFHFKEVVLSEEAEAERLRPVKSILDDWFKDKRLMCCETAMSDFQRIVGCVAGSSERKRAEDLISRLTVVPDEVSSVAEELPLGRRIKKRSQVIFGTGDNLKLITVTANSAFVRAASVQGVKFVALEHEARAFSEKKQLCEEVSE